MYNPANIEKTPSFTELKIGLKLTLLSVVGLQLIFQILAKGYIEVISSIHNFASLPFLDPRGLNSFTWDMWLTVIVLSVALFGFSIVKKVKDLPLYLLITYPSILILFSLVRDVSLIQVLVLSLLAFALILQINLKRVNQVIYDEA